MNLRFLKALEYTAKPRIQSVLDVGCGGGHYCVGFLEQGKTVLGLDIAEGMLEIAKKKTTEYIKKGQIEYVLDGYLEHKFNKKFDAACLMGFFDYIKHPVEIFEKLKKDVSKEVYMSFPKKGGFLAWQRKIRYNMRNCPLYLYSKEDLVKHLKEAGWYEKAEIIDLKRDYFVIVRLD